MTQVVEAARVRQVSQMACRACGAVLADAAARVEVCGLHRHEGRNPGGERYVVLCFAAAPGVEVASNPSSEWSWFPGYRWQVVACGRCGVHVGWKYVAGGGGGGGVGGGGDFFGLIEDRVVVSATRPDDG